jgi:uncharacterized protein DUF3300
MKPNSMRKHRRMILSLTGMASLCLTGGRAMGQQYGEAPQYPQYVQYPQGAPPVVPGVPGAQTILSPDQIDQLLGPIALYPDPLLSLIFPAATYPQDVQASEQWLASAPNPTEAVIAAEPWDASIKGLVHYPTVLKMMSDQIDWTQAVGAAFINQQQDVLSSVQRLRAQAEAQKNLQTNQQEQVVAEGNSILIEPVDPNVMYVPQYDPNLVYTSAYPVSYGSGYAIGLWDDDDFNWGGGYIEFGGGWFNGWHHPEAWDRNPPAWDRHPNGWVAAPRQWARASQRSAPPRLTSASVAHLNLNQPRGASAVKLAPGNARQAPAPMPITRQPTAEPLNNAFNSNQSRADVQRSVQQARPAPAARAAPAPRAAPARAAPAQAAPERAAPAQAAPRAAAPAAPRQAPNNAFNGGSASDARAQGNRGRSSAGRH